MGTRNEYGFKSPDVATVVSRGKNKSVKREFGTDGQNTTGASSKNASGDKETPLHDPTINRNPQGSQYDPYGVARSRNSHGARNDRIDKEHTVQKITSKNKGVAKKTDPGTPHIASGKTKVNNYPPGRNRGRNFKG